MNDGQGACLTADAAMGYVCGGISSDERAAAEVHMDGCAACRRWVIDLAEDSMLRAATPEPAPGAPRERGVLVGRYQIRELLGMGGMGMVYRAFDPVLERHIALKLVAEPSDAARARLLVEARTSAKITHPNVVAVHDAGVVDDEVYVAMERVDGTTLARWLEEPRPVTAVIALFVQAGRGLEAAHRAGVIHRDFKPSNVMIGRDGRARVTDFGLARMSRAGTATSDTPALAMRPGGAVAPTITRTGTLLGTPVYMAPEQLAGVKVDARADQFAFAAVLFEAVCGVRPFLGEQPEELVRAIRTGELSAPARSDVPPPLLAILRQALSVDPRRRFKSMAELLDAIGSLSIARTVTIERPADHGGRWWLPAVTAVAAALLAVVSLSLWRRADARAAAAASDDARPRIDRMVRLTELPGCEESPVFTPDGRTVIYDGDELGDDELFAVDVATGLRRRLTRERGWDLMPRVSPDGTRVAYAHRADGVRELRVMSLVDATVRSLGTLTSWPAWLDDDTLVVGNDRGALDRVDIATGSRRPHAQLDGASLHAPVPLANGSWVYVARHDDRIRLAVDDTLLPVSAWEPNTMFGLAAGRSGDSVYFVGKAASGAHAIIRRSLSTGGEVALPTPAPGHGVDVSPDGRKLVFSTCRNSARIARIGEGGTAVPVALWSRHDWDERAVVMVDVSHVAVESSRRAESEIWLVDLATGDGKVISIGDGHDPAVSPDRRWLTYASSHRGGEGIHIVDLATGLDRRLTRDGNDSSPSVSHDGRLIVALRRDRPLLIPTDGSAVRELPIADVLQIVASPATPHIAYVIRSHTELRVLLGTVDQMPVELAGLPPGSYVGAAFSPDGKRLLLVRAFKELIEAQVDGSGLRTVWSAPFSPFGTQTIDRAVYAPGGGYLVTHSSARGDLFLAEGVFP